jgi:hypothetical protein
MPGESSCVGVTVCLDPAMKPMIAFKGEFLGQLSSPSTAPSGNSNLKTDLKATPNQRVLLPDNHISDYKFVRCSRVPPTNSVQLFLRRHRRFLHFMHSSSVDKGLFRLLIPFLRSESDTMINSGRKWFFDSHIAGLLTVNISVASSGKPRPEK